MKRLLAVTGAFTLLSCGGDVSLDDVGACASALTSCAAGPVVKGLDCSYYDGTIDWAQVKASGRVFAVARVSDGTGFVDPQFTANWQHMKSAGVVRGVYQFFRASQDPVAQANLLLTKVAAAGGFQPGDLPPVIDLETADGQSAATVQARVQIWLDHVERAVNKKPLIYSGPSNSSLTAGKFTAYPLWVPNWGVTCPSLPTGWTHWKIWQYTDTGTVPGMASGVDLDEFNGTYQDLIDFAHTVVDAGVVVVHDAGVHDAGVRDAGVHDTGVHDAGIDDAGVIADAGDIETPPDADGGYGEKMGGGETPDAGPSCF